MKKILFWTLAVLLSLNGLFFMTNIYAVGNPEAAVEMHDDLHPEAGPVVAIAKVINVFLTGLLYVLGAWGMIRRKPRLAKSAIWGSLIFTLFYIYQFIAWGRSHPRVWLDFAIFGTIGITLGLSSYLWARAQKKR